MATEEEEEEEEEIRYVHTCMYSQQRPMRTNPDLLCCLGLIDNGQYKSTNRLLVVVPHERPHGIMEFVSLDQKCVCALVLASTGTGPDVMAEMSS